MIQEERKEGAKEERLRREQNTFLIPTHETSHPISAHRLASS
jgi:hypothetical protein